MKTKTYNPFLFAQEQFDNAANLLELNKVTREFLRTPMREFHFNISVRMDDGTRKVFKAFRIVHNDARGPAKGGIRFHPMETVDTIRAMSMWMTWKTAVADIPLGGSKGGVRVSYSDINNATVLIEVAKKRNNYVQTGYKIGGLLDITIITDEDFENKNSYANKIGDTLNTAKIMKMGTELYS